MENKIIVTGRSYPSLLELGRDSVKETGTPFHNYVMWWDIDLPCSALAKEIGRRFNAYIVLEEVEITDEVK